MFSPRFFVQHVDGCTRDFPVLAFVASGWQLELSFPPLGTCQQLHISLGLLLIASVSPFPVMDSVITPLSRSSS